MGSSILKDEVCRKKPIKDLPHLKRVLKNKWKKIDQDKAILRRMMSTFPVQAMLELDGAQVHKLDYSVPRGDD